MNKFQLTDEAALYGDYVVLESGEAMPSKRVLEHLLNSAFAIACNTKMAGYKKLTVVLKDFTQDADPLPDDLKGQRTAGFKVYITKESGECNDGSEVQEEARND